MPRPVMPKFDIDAANIASKLPEPLRKPAGTLLEALLQVTGAEDPNNVMQSIPAGPLVSFYKDAAGVPSKALRELGTTRSVAISKANAEKLGAPAIGDAFEEFAQKYPRIAAHFKVRPEITPRNVVGSVNTDALRYLNPSDPSLGINTIPLDVGQAGIDAINEAPILAKNLIAHEGTHVAQRLGAGDDYGKLYSISNRLTGYFKNPFERTARFNGNEASLIPNTDNHAKVGVTQLLRELSRRTSFPQATAERWELEPLKDTLKDILDRRLNPRFIKMKWGPR
jgi:hypothetical protein